MNTKQKMSLLIASSSLVGLAFLPATIYAQDTTASFNLTAPTSNQLSFQSASDLNFGSLELSNAAISQNSTNDVAIVINDLRGTGTGWKVTGTLGKFTDSTKELKGAAITFVSGSAVTAGANSVTFDTDKNVTLDAGAAAGSRLINATTNEGNGQTTTTYTKDNVQLTAPTGQLVGNYTATLTYTLSDTPDAN
ncbi:WxL domain-containing protein [uncultured Enterococcus sp.]|uniref:WxL domain-containing protein n=1 Tax=uncultured Enterococcus sp. TaxID=167972 RepID=UPI0025E0141E|nr:WxL domain-containing protein [uncultured Enterococcus sp.]